MVGDIINSDTCTMLILLPVATIVHASQPWHDMYSFGSLAYEMPIIGGQHELSLQACLCYQSSCKLLLLQEHCVCSVICCCYF